MGGGKGRRCGEEGEKVWREGRRCRGGGEGKRWGGGGGMGGEGEKVWGRGRMWGEGCKGRGERCEGGKDVSSVSSEAGWGGVKDSSTLSQPSTEARHSSAHSL